MIESQRDAIRALGVEFREIDTTNIRDISSEVIGDDGRLKIMPTAYWDTTTADERAVFGNRYALYGFPTIELVEHLKELIGGRPAIEIAAGSGILAQALDIPATDSYQQETEPYRTALLAAGSPTVKYGPNVIRMHASRAVRHFKPQVVVGSWITHKYDRDRHFAGGNEVGVDLPDILRNCGELILIGNQHVHRYSNIWDRKHTIEFPDFVRSRKTNETPDFIARWKGLKRF